MATVSVFAASGIQRYVFRSNKLKENVGASVLVEDALVKHLEPRARSQGGELIYAAGGKAAWIFPSPEPTDRTEGARQATFDWSRDLLAKAPGLRVSAAHECFEAGGLKDAYTSAVRDLDAVEEAPPPGATLLALPIVRTCATTGLPATTRLGTEYLSTESMRKRDAAESARRVFEDRFEAVLLDPGGNLEFPIELDHLGGEPGSFHIAVVHADGNGIGRRLAEYARGAASDGEFIEKMHGFTEGIRTAGETAFLDVLRRLRPALHRLAVEKVLHCRPGILPIRPLVVGGDDLTFVCDGRIGLSLAASYLAALEKEKLGDGAPIDACAGVAIVRGRFPFARAYAIAEELCASAKNARRITREYDASACGSWIDFQVIRSGAGGSIASGRARGMSDGEGDEIRKRPWPLTRTDRPGWPELQAAARHLATWPRSRAKALLAAFEEGPAAVDDQLAWARSRAIEPPPNFGKQFLFDPLDVLDFFTEV